MDSRLAGVGFPPLTLQSSLRFTTLSRNKQINWVLGFRALAVLQREVASSCVAFITDILGYTFLVAEARLRAFGGYGRALEHTGVILLQRLPDGGILSDCLIRFVSARGLWGPIKQCRCRFNGWKTDHIKNAWPTRSGDTKTVSLDCPVCQRRVIVRAHDQVQFVDERTDKPGEAYSKHLINHFVVPFPAKVMDVVFSEDEVRLFPLIDSQFD